jgi:hypothetical protein
MISPRQVSSKQDDDGYKKVVRKTRGKNMKYRSPVEERKQDVPSLRKTPTLQKTPMHQKTTCPLKIDLGDVIAMENTEGHNVLIGTSLPPRNSVKSDGSGPWDKTKSYHCHLTVVRANMQNISARFILVLTAESRVNLRENREHGMIVVNALNNEVIGRHIPTKNYELFGEVACVAQPLKINSHNNTTEITGDIDYVLNSMSSTVLPAKVTEPALSAEDKIIRPPGMSSPGRNSEKSPSQSDTPPILQSELPSLKLPDSSAWKSGPPLRIRSSEDILVADNSRTISVESCETDSYEMRFSQQMAEYIKNIVSIEVENIIRKHKYQT